jgi:hypothetical protein
VPFGRDSRGYGHDAVAFVIGASPESDDDDEKDKEKGDINSKQSEGQGSKGTNSTTKPKCDVLWGDYCNQ